MVGVGQFIGSSSAITAFMKGTPCCSSSWALTIWYWTSWRHSKLASHYGGTSCEANVGGSYFSVIGSAGTEVPPVVFSSWASILDGWSYGQGPTLPHVP
ncbi:UNVERIFIED_CONTAM: hypothetical protein Sradi_1328500 [Sesamum radiatum]|uniref:Uncharacterized protein n=1 Tax=Sesamum radiatum TaxID=300843 RepID=A0AAW2UQM2_SESRA